ncbi:MAG: TonB-dependent receptor plug domain-containing protein, partial [Betaproteobacteria bacterium]|nr:TonB-dependent receptor plug domain-containing protein [Betaproteobacteria bacterium]
MTHSQMKNMTRAILGALGKGAAISLVAAPIAFAQTPAPTPQKVEKIEVTGSNIKRVDEETSAPIQIINRADIEKSGKQTVAELLRQLPIVGGGGLNDLTSSNSFSSGVSTVSLRGLGSTATLVLLNGRRVAPVGLADPNFGQSAVVNLDTFPVSVIERIEILKDGASAIYGSEAVAGVINIILRKDYSGYEASGSYSANRDSEYKIFRVTATGGWGDLARDRYNTFVTYEHTKRYDSNLNDVGAFVVDPRLTASGYATARHYSSSFAGNYLNAVVAPSGIATAISFKPAAQQPANCDPLAIKDASGICRFDLVPRTNFFPASTRDNVFWKGQYDFSANLTGFLEAGFNRTKTYFLGNPQVYGDF